MDNKYGNIMPFKMFYINLEIIYKMGNCVCLTPEVPIALMVMDWLIAKVVWVDGTAISKKKM